MNSWIYVLLVFYHNYVWYCCHLWWGIWSELNKSWFSNHEVKKNRQVVNYCSKQFLIAVSLHMHAHIFDKYQSFQALLLGIKCRVWIVLTERESLVLSDSCQWYIQSVCVFRQVLLLWRWVSGLVHYSTGEVGMTVYIIDKFIPHITDLLTYKMLHDRLGTKDSVLMSHFLR